MKTFIYFLAAFFLLLTSSCSAAPRANDNDTDAPGFYRRAMIHLVEQLAQTAHKTKPTFGFITNNATDLYQNDPQLHGDEKILLQSVNGALCEGIRYNWKNSKMGYTSSSDYTATVLTNIVALQKAQKALFSIDYCGNSTKKAFHAIEANEPYGIVTFPALTKELTSLEWGSLEKNSKYDITRLNQAHSLIVLLNPEKFATRQAYLAALHASDADLLIIDLYYGDTPLTAQQVAALQRRSNGTRRLVYAYLSIGEAEDYRPYWQKSWSKHAPDWLNSENSQWEGDYLVKYWSEPWQAILFKNKDSYLQQIINAGFDGAFLDTVDSYESWEDIKDNG